MGPHKGPAPNNVGGPPQVPKKRGDPGEKFKHRGERGPRWGGSPSAAPTIFGGERPPGEKKTGKTTPNSGANQSPGGTSFVLGGVPQFGKGGGKPPQTTEPEARYKKKVKTWAGPRTKCEGNQSFGERGLLFS